MVDVSSQNNSVSINVSTGGNSASIKATPDMAQYYSEKSREWAISNRIVDNVDYSSKYYADKANESAAKAESAKQLVTEAKDGVIAEVKQEAQVQISTIQQVSQLEQEEVQKVINRIEEGKAVYVGEDEPTDPIYTVWVSPEDNETSLNIEEINTEIANVKTDLDTIEKTTLKTNQITNCITEIPQDIKLELNDGVLALKAGSKVYVPNGFEADGVTPKFDEVVIESDLTNATTGGAKMFLTVYNNGTNLLAGYTTGETVTERPVSPTNYALYYNTTTNKVEFYNGSSWVSNCSFPISLYTRGSIGATSIDQIFNGFGYIGSTVFALPNVKGLIPNGRNEDGSLNNIEFTVPKVMTWTNNNNSRRNIYLRQDGIVAYAGGYTTRDYLPQGGTVSGRIYIKSENKIYYWYNNVYSQEKAVELGEIEFNSSSPYNVVSFPKSIQPFQASNDNTPHIIETYQKGNSWYRVWSDGWCEQGGLTTVENVTLMKPMQHGSNGTYNVQTAPLSNSAVYNGQTVWYVSTTGFTIIGAKSTSGGAYWSASGYLV